MPRPDASDKLKATQPKTGPSKVLIAAVVAVALIIVGGIAWLRTDPFGALEAKPPKSGNAEGGGVVAYPGKAKPGAPTVDLYEDFQCPFCADLERLNGKTIGAQAAAGDIKLVIHVLSFMDENLRNDSSTRAANAAFCAADAGKFAPYHAAVFAAQPEREGVGFTDAALKQAARTAGISGGALSAFDSCLSKGTYNNYVKDSQKAANNDGVNGTPSLKINGKRLEQGEVKPLYTSAGTWPSVLQAAK